MPISPAAVQGGMRQRGDPYRVRLLKAHPGHPMVQIAQPAWRTRSLARCIPQRLRGFFGICAGSESAVYCTRGCSEQAAIAFQLSQRNLVEGEVAALGLRQKEAGDDDQCISGHREDADGTSQFHGGAEVTHKRRA